MDAREPLRARFARAAAGTPCSRTYSRERRKRRRRVGLPAADAADALHAGQLPLALAQRLRRLPAIGDVAKRRADAVAEREGADLVVAVRPLDRICLELLPRALGHHLR